MRFLRRKLMAPAWDSGSAAPSWNRMEAACGLPTTLHAEQAFTLPYPPRWRPMNDARKGGIQAPIPKYNCAALATLLDFKHGHSGKDQTSSDCRRRRFDAQRTAGLAAKCRISCTIVCLSGRIPEVRPTASDCLFDRRHPHAGNVRSRTAGAAERRTLQDSDHLHHSTRRRKIADAGVAVRCSGVY